MIRFDEEDRVTLKDTASVGRVTPEFMYLVSDLTDDINSSGVLGKLLENETGNYMSMVESWSFDMGGISVVYDESRCSCCRSFTSAYFTFTELQEALHKNKED